jgi:ribosomal protein S14
MTARTRHCLECGAEHALFDNPCPHCGMPNGVVSVLKLGLFLAVIGAFVVVTIAVKVYLHL